MEKTKEEGSSKVGITELWLYLFLFYSNNLYLRKHEITSLCLLPCPFLSHSPVYFSFFIVMDEFVNVQKRLLKVRQRAKIKAITFELSHSNHENFQFRQENIGMSDEKRPSKVSFILF